MTKLDVGRSSLHMFYVYTISQLNIYMYVMYKSSLLASGYEIDCFKHIYSCCTALAKGQGAACNFLAVETSFYT